MFTAKANYSSLATSITEYADFNNSEPLNFSYNKYCKILSLEPREAIQIISNILKQLEALICRII